VIQAAQWLHLTGITFGLSGTCVETAVALLAEAVRLGLTISFDVNYRAALWTPAQAALALMPVCIQANVVIVALRDAVSLFGTEDNLHAAAQQLYTQFQSPSQSPSEPHGKRIIVTNGSAGAVGTDEAGIVECPAYSVTIVDRLGAGDSFAAGVICRLSESATLLESLRFGTAVAALKLTIPGDIALITRAEVEALLNSGEQSLLR